MSWTNLERVWTNQGPDEFTEKYEEHLQSIGVISFLLDFVVKHFPDMLWTPHVIPLPGEEDGGPGSTSWPTTYLCPA